MDDDFVRIVNFGDDEEPGTPVDAAAVAEAWAIKDHPTAKLEGRNLKKLQRWPKVEADVQNETERQLKCLKDIDPSRYYCKTTDDNGHSVYIKFRLPQNFAGAIAYLISKIPAYRSRDDLVRDSLVKQMAYLALHEENIDPQPLADCYIKLEADQAVEQLKRNQEAVKSMITTVKAHAEAGAWEDLAQALERIEGHAQVMSEPFRSRILRRLEWGKEILILRKRPRKKRGPGRPRKRR